MNNNPCDCSKKAVGTCLVEPERIWIRFCRIQIRLRFKRHGHGSVQALLSRVSVPCDSVVHSLYTRLTSLCTLDCSSIDTKVNKHCLYKFQENVLYELVLLDKVC